MEAVQPEMGIVSRVLTSVGEIDAVAAAWRALEADCADPLSYFQSFDWRRNWLEHHAEGSGAEPHVLTLWRGDLLLAVWPLMIVRAAGLSRLESLGVPHSQYCGVMVRPGAVGAGELRRFAQETVRNSGCDVAVLRAVPSESVLAGALSGIKAVAGAENTASMLELGQFSSAADYAGKLGKLQKRNRNRRRNHLARLGELEFSVIWPGHPDYAALVRLCAEMKRRWLGETGRFSTGFSIAGFEDFLASLPGDADRLSGACLSVLKAGERVVAMELGFIRRGHYYAYVGGFDWELRHLSPGKVQMDMTVGWLIDNGIATYDLLINPAEYKSSWSSRNIAVSSYAEALTWKGELYARTWLPAVRPALKRLRSRMPELMQTAMAFLRGATCLLLYV